MSESTKKKPRKRSISLAGTAATVEPEQPVAAAPEPVAQTPSKTTGERSAQSKSKTSAKKSASKPAGTNNSSNGVTEKISMYFEQRIFDDIEDEFYEFKDLHPDAHPTLNGFTSQAFEAGLEHFESDEAAEQAFLEDLSLPKPDPGDEDRKRIQRSVYLTPGLKTRIDEEFARWRHEKRAWLRAERLRPKVGNFTQALLKSGLTCAQRPEFAANLPDDPRRSDT